MMPLAWIALVGLLGLGLVLGPLNDTCCLVGPSAEFRTIQAAIDAAPTGSTVVVFGGVYRENVIIDKPLRLLSADHTVLFPLVNKNRPLIQARNDDAPAVEVRASGVTVQGFVVRGGSAGVHIQGRQRVRLNDNAFAQGKTGVQVEGSQDIWISGNRYSHLDGPGVRVEGSQSVRVLASRFDNTGAGVTLADTTHSLVRGNAFRNAQGGALLLEGAPGNALIDNHVLAGPGVTLVESPGTVMRANRLAGGGEGFWVEAAGLEGYDQDIDASNRLGGLPILYLKGLKQRSLKPGIQAGFLALIGAEGVEVPQLRASGVPVGALVVGSHDVKLIQATIHDARAGVVVVESQGVVITDSQISGSRTHGVALLGGQGVEIVRTTVSNSGGHGVFAKGTKALTVRESDVFSNQGSALWLEDVDAGGVNDNVLSDNGQYAVLLRGARALTFEHNRISGNQTGLHLLGAQGIVVVDNQIQGNQFGIFLERASGNTIKNNLITLNVRGGIEGTLDDNQIEGNLEDAPETEVEEEAQNDPGTQDAP